MFESRGSRVPFVERLVFIFLVFAGMVSLASAAVPSVPTGLNAPSANIATSSFTLNWTASTGSPTSYDVFKAGVLFGNSSTTSLNITGLTAGTSYSMTVKAKNASGSSAASTALSVPTLPNAPIGLTSSAATDTSFTFSWSATTGATGYDIFNGGTLVGSSATTSLSITGLLANTAYSMTVKGKNASGSSAASTALNVTTAPSAPVGLDAPTANITTTSFVLNWSASVGATSYDVYKGGTLVGNSTSTSRSITGLSAGTTYSMTVKAKNASGTSAASSAQLVSTLVAIPGAPTGLAASFILSTSATLSWTAPTTGGAPIGYDIYNGATVVGSTTTSLTFNVTGLARSTAYSLTVKAKNTTGSSAASNTAHFTTVANNLPTVSITAPVANSIYTWPTTVTLTATASDSDGTIAKVEFFNGLTSLGQTASSPYTVAWSPVSPVSANLTAKATDNLGGTTTSNPVPVRFLGSVPLHIDFETSEGFSVGNLDGQNGWVVDAGAAQISTADAANGTQSALLLADPAPTELDQEFGSMTTNPSIVYVDFWTKPVAGVDYNSGTLLDIDSARIAFILDGGQGRFALLDGDGNGSGVYRNVGPSIVVDGSNASIFWQRITVRLDYTAKTWDFFLNGKLIFADETFRVNSATYFSWFSLKGHVAGNVKLDNILVSAVNPLFTDANNDGIDDAWESAHGLSTTVSSRNGDPDGDGLTNIQEYIYGTNPQSADTDGDGISDSAEIAAGTNPNVDENAFGPAKISGLRLFLTADAGNYPDASGFIAQWLDQSGREMNGFVSGSANFPQVVPNGLNGHSVVRFSSVDNPIGFPDVMNGLSQGEVFIVVKSSNDEKYFWDWAGGGGPSCYPWQNGKIYDGWGSSSGRDTGEPVADITTFNIYNVSSMQDNWTSRFNGLPNFQTTTNTPAFNTTPKIGGNGFSGDIAEMIVYDHVLTDDDRTAINNYLEQKYALAPAPNAPTALSVTALSSSQANIAWKGVQAAVGVSYIIERQDGGGDFAAVAIVAESQSYIDTGLTADLTYTYRVRMISGGVTSPYSESVPITISGLGPDMPLDGVRLWLKADAIATVSNVALWPDQSGSENDAKTSSENQPTLVPNGLNGHPVVRFSSTTDALVFPDVMNGLSQGEVFVVVKASSNKQGLWQWGQSPYPSYYPWDNGKIYDGWGSSTSRDNGQPSADITSFNVYNVSSQQDEWISRFNGLPDFQTSVNTPGFTATPQLGGNGFSGDIAEMIVYDHVLTNNDRTAVNNYLEQKYALAPAPTAPTGLSVLALSSSQANIIWHGQQTAVGVFYALERQTGSGPFIAIATVSESQSYVDSGLVAGTTYTYRLRTVSGGLASSYCNSVPITVAGLGPDMPLAGMRLWLKADAIATSGSVGIWADQSGNQNHAKTFTASTPTLEPNVLNGYPTVRFASTTDSLSFPDVMNGLSQGEVFIVLKASSSKQGLWQWGQSQFSAYYPWDSGKIYDGWGSSVDRDTGEPSADITTFNIYNVSSQQNEWVSRFNGSTNFRTTTNTPAFSVAPQIGGSGFSGDFAEMIVFDHVLSDQDRIGVNNYLEQKYALAPPPTAPTALSAKAISTSQVSLNWQGPQTSFGVFYSVERKTPVADFTPIGLVSRDQNFIDEGLEAGENYTYRVREISAGVASTYSSEINVDTMPIGSAMPRNGIRLWLKADTMASDAAVGTWLDQSGNMNDGHIITATMPQLVANGLNGHSVVRFSSDNGALVFPDVMNGAQGGEIFAVLKASTTKQLLWAWGQNTSQQTFFPWDSGKIYEGWGSSVDRDTGVPVVDISSFNIYNISSTAGFWSSRFNGAEHFKTYANSPGFNSAPTIGGSGLSADIAEVIVYDHVLTMHEREAVNYYLNIKYGVVDGKQFRSFRDANGDGVLDAVGFSIGLNEDSVDLDGDGLSNAAELRLGTNPFLADTDGDGVSDYLDAFPLDPLRSHSPSPSGGDTSAPVITLISPANAVPLP